MSGFDDTERYICNNCYGEFTDPLIVADEQHCPYCYGDDFEPLVRCECCHDWFAKSEMKTEEYCSDCVNDSIKLMRDYMEHGKPMAADYRKVFLDYFDCL